MLKMFVNICNTILTILGKKLGQTFNFLSLQKKMCLNESYHFLSSNIYQLLKFNFLKNNSFLRKIFPY